MTVSKRLIVHCNSVTVSVVKCVYLLPFFENMYMYNKKEPSLQYITFVRCGS